jgi:IclR family acetate operon transcriptional repressor
MARTGKPAVRHVAAVERAIGVLDALADGELGTNEIARRTGLTASTASRQLATLAAGGLVEHVAETGRYRLGLRLVELADAALGRLDVRGLARPLLQELVDATGETATLSLPGDDEAITVDFVQSPQSVRSVAQLGRPSVGHATAAGKVVLAFGDDPGEQARQASPLRAYTSRTIVDAGTLARELEIARGRGWTLAAGEREEDLNAIAAPVRGAAGELAAVLGLQGPATRFAAEQMEAAVPALLGRALLLSRALGWHPV